MEYNHLKTKRSFSILEAFEIEKENLKLKENFKKSYKTMEIKLNKNYQVIITNYVFYYEENLEFLNENDFNPFLLKI